MPERPHIFFATPSVAHRHAPGGGVTNLHKPTGRRQVDRLNPQFSALERAFEQRRAELRTDVPGIEPEEMLVLETVGRVEDFVKAVRRLPGLEWLGDVDIEGLPSDEDFYSERDRERALTGRLYLIMANQRGLTELQRLWGLFQQDPDHPRFQRGRTKWRDLFRLLREIRPWGPEDRLRATGFADELEDRVAGAQELVTAELELWYRSAPQDRARAETVITRLTEEVLGRVVRRSVIQEIQYHGLLVALPMDSAQAVVRDHGSPLVRAAQVLKIRPVGQAMTFAPEGEAEPEPPREPFEPDDREPIVALLDGLPLQQHQRLAGHLRVDDPDGWEARYPAASRLHGPAMASLIIHGDLASGEQPIGRPIYVRPILQPVPAGGPRASEGIPDDELPVDLVHRAVTRLFRGVDGGEPAAPSIRVVNHSVGDPRRPFDYSIGAWARALDHLAAAHQVLIVVSAGNVDLPLDVPSPAEGQQDGQETLGRSALDAIVAAPWARRLLSPGEGMNLLTVGSTHDDASTDVPLGTLVDLFPRGGASPFSRHGPGYRRSIKPELVLPGGRVVFAAARTDGNGRRSFQIRDTTRPPGQLVAAPGSPGRLDQVHHSRGTSNSAALATRAAARLFDMLDRLRADPGGETLQRHHEAALLKALLVHGTSAPPGLPLDDANDDGARTRVRLVGYGQLDLDRVLTSSDNRVTLIGWGRLQDGDAHQFELPLPPSLSGVTLERRVTVTLGWMTPINPRHRAYRRASLWFDPYATAQGGADDVMKALGLRRLESDYTRPRRGTVQHEVFTGSRAAVFEAGRSATIQVNCRSETGDLGGTRIAYGLIVTVETPAELPIYEEIRIRLRPPVPVAVGADTGRGAESE